MSDLIYFSEPAITSFNPNKVFIYEGDNDLASGKKPEEVIQDAMTIIKKIRNILPVCAIVFISAKPSPSRWSLKDEYRKLNDMYSNLVSEYRNVGFVNVWDPALNNRGMPRSEIFVSDSLHMNEKGYEIWAKAIGKILY